MFSPNHACADRNLSLLFNPEKAILCYKQLMLNHTIEDLLNKMTVNLSESVEKIWENGAHPSQISGRLVQFYWAESKCLKIQLYQDPSHKINNNNNSLLYFTNMEYAGIIGKAEYRRIFDKKLLAFFFFHDPESHVRGIGVRPHIDRIWTGNSRRFYTYVKFEYDYLPPPYFSMCIDYRKQKLESKEECIDICMKKEIKRTIDPNAAISQLTLTRKEWQSSPQLRFYGDTLYQVGNETFKEHNRMIFELYERCNSKCPFGCQSYFYETQFLVALTSLKSYEFGFMNLNIARKLVFSPKFDTLSYIIFIASVCSLWMGFVIFDSFIALARFSNRSKPSRSVNISSTLFNIANFHMNMVVEAEGKPEERIFFKRKIPGSQSIVSC